MGVQERESVEGDVKGEVLNVCFIWLWKCPDAVHWIDMKTESHCLLSLWYNAFQFGHSCSFIHVYDFGVGLFAPK